MRFRIPRLRAGPRPSLPRSRLRAQAPTAGPTRARSSGRGCPTRRTPSQGKDRPVLVIGQEGGELLALAADLARTTTVDAAQERARRPRVDGHRHRRLGLASGRPSEVRLNRLLRLDPAGVRREGAALPEGRLRRRARGRPPLPLSPQPSALRIRASETGWAVPRLCAQRLTRYSSSIHRTRRRSGAHRAALGERVDAVLPGLLERVDAAHQLPVAGQVAEAARRARPSP